MPTRFVDFDIPGGTRHTINAYEVVRVIPRDAKTCVIALLRPKPAVVVLGSDQSVREKLACALTQSAGSEGAA
jgi:hypothetical protein